MHIRQPKWYVIQVETGREQAMCQLIERVGAEASLESDEDGYQLLEECFSPQYVTRHKIHGEWRTEVVDFFRGYFVAVTKDAPALSRVLVKLTFPVHMVGAVGRGYQPISEDAQKLLEQTMDKGHIVRLSWGEIVSDALRVQGGPLKGLEDRIAKFVRGKSFAFVRVGEGDGAAATLTMPLAILARR